MMDSPASVYSASARPSQAQRSACPFWSSHWAYSVRASALFHRKCSAWSQGSGARTTSRATSGPSATSRPAGTAASAVDRRASPSTP